MKEINEEKERGKRKQMKGRRRNKTSNEDLQLLICVYSKFKVEI